MLRILKINNRHSSRGAFLIELLFAFPLFLFLLLLILWLPLYLETRAVFTTSVSKAARLASTRGDDIRMTGNNKNYYLFDTLSKWVDDGIHTGLVMPPDSISELIFKDVPWDYARQLFMENEHYLWFDQDKLYVQERNLIFLYFLHGFMAQIGKRIKYPCIPGKYFEGDDVGCLFCEFKLDGQIEDFLATCKFKPNNPVASFLASVGSIVGFDTAIFEPVYTQEVRINLQANEGPPNYCFNC